MSFRIWAAVELALAAAAMVGCALSGAQVRSTVAVAPILDGQPVTTSVVYDPPMLLLTLLLAAVAGVLAVLGAARVWRSRQQQPSTR